MTGLRGLGLESGGELMGETSREPGPGGRVFRRNNNKQKNIKTKISNRAIVLLALLLAPTMTGPFI